MLLKLIGLTLKINSKHGAYEFQVNCLGIIVAGFIPLATRASDLAVLKKLQDVTDKNTGAETVDINRPEAFRMRVVRAGT